MKLHSQKFIQKRKFIMVLPILVMPFLTMTFWALGGGQGTAASAKEMKKAGLNLELPNAQFKNDKNSWDKLSLYQKAKRDSMKYNEAKRIDPYFRLPALRTGEDTSKRRSGNVNTSLGKKEHSVDENEERVNKKLDDLYKNLNAKENKRRPRYERRQPSMNDPTFTGDIEKLESLMEMMQTNGAEDEEMKEMQSVLDKILDVQHPERVKEKLREQGLKNPKQAFHVSTRDDLSIGLMESLPIGNDSVTLSSVNSFYGIDEISSVENLPKAIAAEVYDAQTLIAGSVVKLKLANDIYVNGSLVPKNRFVYGICAINGERLTITINSIRNGQAVFPVALAVYDLDGIEGIYIPGAIARDVAKQSSNQALQNVQLNSLDPSLGVQAASAGIETVKSLISKKTKLIKVSVKAGYKVLLIDTRNNQ
jgi:conjugative transposon TraM protein